MVKFIFQFSVFGFLKTSYPLNKRKTIHGLFRDNSTLGFFPFDLYFKSVDLSKHSLAYHGQVFPWCKEDTLIYYSMSLDLINFKCLSEWPTLDAF